MPRRPVRGRTSRCGAGTHGRAARKPAVPPHVARAARTRPHVTTGIPLVTSLELNGRRCAGGHWWHRRVDRGELDGRWSRPPPTSPTIDAPLPRAPRATAPTGRDEPTTSSDEMTGIWSNGDGGGDGGSNGSRRHETWGRCLESLCPPYGD